MMRATNFSKTGHRTDRWDIRALGIGSLLVLVALVALLLAGCDDKDKGDGIDLDIAKACKKMAKEGFRPVATSQTERFLGKVQPYTAICRGGLDATKYQHTPWVDWPHYFATGDASTRSDRAYEDWLEKHDVGIDINHVSRNGRGVDGALLDLEYQRMEEIRFNLYDNYGTYDDYVKGRDGVPGPSLKTWEEMRLPPDHPRYADVGGDGEQLCEGDLIRHRTLTGICNDMVNPLMGATGTPFARNVSFDSTFPRLSENELTRNRHGDRISLLEPDPQVISRELFTRIQSAPDQCNEGKGLDGWSAEAHCDYQEAPFFNVLAAFWIQFMTHDWFSHLEEGVNAPKMMEVGCEKKLVDGEYVELSEEEIAELGCRPGDRMDRSLYAETDDPGTFEHDGETYLKRAPKTTANTNTAWWDASQLYGYDETSRMRVKRDPDDGAKLLMERVGDRDGEGEAQGYLPLLETDDPMNSAWRGQEATAFPDNWTVGLSFLHNVFAREHNLFVDAFREQAAATPDADSGLRDPAAPDEVITYAEVTDDELFEAARLVVAAEIAKIHTIEWTTQLLYDEPLFLAMNSNWNGLFADSPVVSRALEKIITQFGSSDDVEKSGKWYSIFASGPGIFGLGSQDPDWSLDDPKKVNGGINHFGSPFNFPEEFTTVYRLHPLVPDLIEYREAEEPNAIAKKVPVVATFRGKATDAMYDNGLADWGLSMGRQRLGLLTLQNHGQFLQNLEMRKLQGASGKIDVAALDVLRDRERGVPRFNEFRRQYGLKTLTSFDDFVDPTASPEEQERQREIVAKMREVYGQHVCDDSKVITDAQLHDDGSPITDCLGHPDGTVVDNIEDVDTVVGWLAEFKRPHGFAISETQFQVFILNASRRLFSDRFFTSSFRPEFYTSLGVTWVNNNGLEKKMEKGKPNGHEMEVSPMKRVLMRTLPELRDELEHVVNAFDPWGRDRGEYYSLAWEPRPDVKEAGDPSFE